ncbi:DUF6214 family protein [Streptomyces sp. NPDC005931]|uniref:DUF6214 family protein n=1 Tax=Streptomyces sp. NPDC005931 TaxID=3364737 RepID=UPI003693FA49
MSLWPAWEVRVGERATRWFHVRLAFPDGARVEALALVAEGRVCVEDVRARPALPVTDLALFAERIAGPLGRAGGAGDGPVHAAPEDGPGGGREGVRARARRGGRAGQRAPERHRLAAREYRAAQQAGADPVLAVMGATGHSRRAALRLIGRARDAGLLTPRHARR